MVTEQEEISLGYLLDPAFQLVNSNGKPLTDGWIECYIHGTRNKYYCYSDWNGNLHPFRVPIDSIGSNVVLADPNRAYDVYVYNKYGTLVMSRYNVSPGHASGASVGGSGDAGHWIARLGSTTTAPKNQYSNSIPIPANPDYEGDFVDRINGNNIYLKEGVYLVDAILRFRQNPDDLSNTFGDIHVFTGVDDAETVVYDRNETGPDADETDYHQIRVQFVRHVTGNTDDVVCFQVKSTNALSWIQIQNLSIVKLGGGSGVAPQPIEYSAGQYISIDNDEISVTGLQPSGNYANAESVAQAFYGVAQQINTLSGAIDDVASSIPSIEGLASEQYVDEHIEEAVSGKADRSEIPSLEGYATESYVQSQVSGKADKSEIPSLDGYATETYVQSAVSGKQDELEFTYDSDNKITSIDGHGIAGTGGGGGGGSEYIPGQYISIQNDVISVTGLQPSGDYQPAGDYLTQDDLNGYATTEDVEEAVSGKADVSAIPSVAGLASEQYVDEHIAEATSGKADVSAIPSLNGYATESWVNEQGFLKEVPQEFVTDSELNSAISGKADKSEIPSVAGLASESYVDEHIEEATSGKLDSSAYTAPVNADWSATSGLSQILNKPEQSQLIPGSGISITPSGADYVISSTGGGSTYTEGDYVSIQNDVISVTGLQPSGEYLGPDDLSGYATESWVGQQGYLTEVPAEYATLDDVDEATSGKADLSAIANLSAGVGISITASGDGYVISSTGGGGSVPEGVMAESGLNYTQNGEISGYNNSAFYDAGINNFVNQNSGAWGGEALPVSGGPGIKFRMDNGILIAETDETVLWSGLASPSDFPLSLSESLSNFEKVELTWIPRYQGDYGSPTVCDVLGTDGHSGTVKYSLVAPYWNANTAWLGWWFLSTSDNQTKLTSEKAAFGNTQTTNALTDGLVCKMVKVVGINRIAGGN